LSGGDLVAVLFMINDARKIQSSQFFDEETTFGAMNALKMQIERYRILFSLYCGKLGIEVIASNRIISKDYIVRFQARLFQILKTKKHFHGIRTK
jgi:hypothetical protein